MSHTSHNRLFAVPVDRIETFLEVQSPRVSQISSGDCSCMCVHLCGCECTSELVICLP